MGIAPRPGVGITRRCARLGLRVSSRSHVTWLRATSCIAGLRRTGRLWNLRGPPSAVAVIRGKLGFLSQASVPNNRRSPRRRLSFWTPHSRRWLRSHVVISCNDGGNAGCVTDARTAPRDAIARRLHGFHAANAAGTIWAFSLSAFSRFALTKRRALFRAFCASSSLWRAEY